MANSDESPVTVLKVIESRSASIGENFSVRRVLPFRAQRTIGPFCFVDHMGPVDLSKMRSGDVLMHPHIGLSTLTYLLSGRIFHKDSLGTEQIIQAGEVNWMTAGKGVTHVEKILPEFRQVNPILHGLQIWIALPRELERCEPSFQHYSKNELPQVSVSGHRISVIAGKFLNLESPVSVSSPLFFVDIEFKNSQPISFIIPYAEAGIYVVEGNLQIGNQTYQSGQLIVLDTAKEISIFSQQAQTRIAVFGGDRLESERFMDWNFVASTKDLLEEAKKNWQEQKFPRVPGESEFVPYPRPPGA